MTVKEEIKSVLSSLNVSISSSLLKDQAVGNVLLPLKGQLNPLTPGMNEIEKEIVLIIKGRNENDLEELSDQIMNDFYNLTTNDIDFPEYQIIHTDNNVQSEIVFKYRKEVTSNA
jgi:hypothetical protein